MARKKRKQKVFLRAPDESIRVQRHDVDGETRFTVPTIFGFKKLVGIARQGSFVWLHAAFRGSNKLG